jgi:hypothetical protein
MLIVFRFLLTALILLVWFTVRVAWSSHLRSPPWLDNRLTAIAVALYPWCFVGLLPLDTGRRSPLDTTWQVIARLTMKQSCQALARGVERAAGLASQRLTTLSCRREATAR